MYRVCMFSVRMPGKQNNCKHVRPAPGNGSGGQQFSGDAEDLFTNISDLDYKKVDSFFVSYAKEGGKADEIAVIAVKDSADTEEAKKSLEAHKENRRKLLDQYEPEEVSRIKDGVIFTSGQYAVFIVSEKSDAVRKAFEEAVK